MDALKKLGLAAIFIGSVIWAAVAPGMQALIPFFLAIVSGLGLREIYADYIDN